MKKGSVLILALWVLFFLAVLAVAVGTRASACIRLAEHMKISAAAQTAARAGVERAILAIKSDRQDQMTGEASEFWSRDNRSLNECAFSVYNLSVVDGLVVTNWGVACESSRTNINNMAQVKSLFENVADNTVAARLTESVREYRQKKKLLTSNGVNGKFETVYELMLVDGITYELFSAVAADITVFDRDCYRGVSAGRILNENSGLDSAVSVEKEIAFVYDRKANKVVYWSQ